MINILPRNLYHINQIRRQFKRQTNVIFELSESEAINNYDLLVEVRKQLSHINYGIATDDFGRGYASLDRIIKTKPDIIKLDRSLIEDIDKEPSKRAFLVGLIEAAKVANSQILAEGVETWGELEILKTLDVDLIQGFLLHRPQSLEDIMSGFHTKNEMDHDRVA
jgi:EAL domain-containing protein (putative c-di-GMP-specific phosphodiesterase class I)